MGVTLQDAGRGCLTVLSQLVLVLPIAATLGKGADMSRTGFRGGRQEQARGTCSIPMTSAPRVSGRRRLTTVSLWPRKVRNRGRWGVSCAGQMGLLGTQILCDVVS
jgi:hypothetical protein